MTGEENVQCAQRENPHKPQHRLPPQPKRRNQADRQQEDDNVQRRVAAGLADVAVFCRLPRSVQVALRRPIEAPEARHRQAGEDVEEGVKEAPDGDERDHDVAEPAEGEIAGVRAGRG